jgi:hypothetical protein
MSDSSSARYTCGEMVVPYLYYVKLNVLQRLCHAPGWQNVKADTVIVLHCKKSAITFSHSDVDAGEVGCSIEVFILNVMLVHWGE